MSNANRASCASSPSLTPERRQLPGTEQNAPTTATPDAMATAGSHSRWLP
jgi:hypothetical protein